MNEILCHKKFIKDARLGIFDNFNNFSLLLRPSEHILSLGKFISFTSDVERLILKSNVFYFQQCNATT